jgi:hypothetical protein
MQSLFDNSELVAIVIAALISAVCLMAAIRTDDQ